MSVCDAIVLLSLWVLTASPLVADSDEILWSLRPVTHPEVPVSPSVTHPIDAFLQNRLSEEGLSPVGSADRRTLIRRVTFDLTGLPPTPEETAAFLDDERPNAYEHLVERLLASPHYGERWGRRWLDLVRYAETHGYERDDPKPNAWKYRDYVISAFNRDVPYDQFLIEQIAGDEVDQPTNESRTATGMYRLGPIDDEPADPVADRFDQIDDMIRTIGTTTMGLSIHCARCHDHKFDPVKQTDYYRMVAILAPSQPFVRDQVESISLILSDESQQTRVQTIRAAVDRQIALRAERIERLLSPHRQAVVGMKGDVEALAQARLTPEELRLKAQLESEIGELRKDAPAGLEMTLGLTDRHEAPPVTHLMIRGDAHRPGDVVAPGFLSAIDDRPPVIQPRPSSRTTGRRLALAHWIASPNHPLTARVMVNRIWQGHFGRGLVGTASDFGVMGDEPSHPDLLDWLASEFVDRCWSVKAMHRLIMTSDAYRRSSCTDPEAVRVDPENLLLWRYSPRRLEAEPIRDAILAVSGSLNREMGGPSIMPEIDAAVLAGQSRPGSGWTVSPGEQANRRSVYIHVKRTLGVPELDLLDAADKNEPCPNRAVTTTAPQALTLLNGKFLHEQAECFADRLRQECGSVPAKQIERAFQLAFNRDPLDEERRISLQFLSDQAVRIQRRSGSGQGRKPDDVALQAFCLVLLNANEFVFVD